MPNETAVDAIRRKGWVQRDDQEDGMIAANDAREAAAKTLRRGSEQMQQTDAPMKRKKSPLYDYMKAGAKDFVEDVKSSVSGTSKGPSMKHRKELLDKDEED